MTYTMKISKDDKILVAGGTGFLGKRIIRRLEKDGYRYVSVSQSTGVDFRNAEATENYFKKERPTIVMNCAAYVGGIKFGLEHEGEIYLNNTLMSTNLLECARKYNVKRFINPISNCSYPDVVQKDFKESEWWDGPLHYTVFVYGFVRKATWVQSYAYAKQYGMDIVNLLVPNMYGPDDHFDEVRSHALGALVKKIIKAKEEKLPEVIIWGSGKPVREWLYVDDCVELFIKSLSLKQTIDPINVGSGTGVSIADLAHLIKKAVGYSGKLRFDTSFPDGAPYKIMNVEQMKKVFEWSPKTKLEVGIKETVAWYYDNLLNRNNLNHRPEKRRV